MIARFVNISQVHSLVRQEKLLWESESYGTAFRNPADRQKIIEGLLKAGLK